MSSVHVYIDRTFTATRRVLGSQCIQNANFFRGSAPDPTGGAYSAPLDPLAGGEGARSPLHKKPFPISSFGLEFRPPPRASRVPPRQTHGYVYGLVKA